MCACARVCVCVCVCVWKQKTHKRSVLHIFTSVCNLVCMWLIILCLCVELLHKNIFFWKVKIVFKEVFAFTRCLWRFACCVCVLRFVCRVLRNGAIVSKTVCKHLDKNCINSWINGSKMSTLQYINVLFHRLLKCITEEKTVHWSSLYIKVHR